MDMDPYEAFPYVHIHIGAYGYGRMDRIAEYTQGIKLNDLRMCVCERNLEASIV